jgi:hypothetical protein
MKISITRNGADGFDIEFSYEFEELLTRWLDLKTKELYKELAIAKAPVPWGLVQDISPDTHLEDLPPGQTEPATPAVKAAEKVVEAQEATKKKIEEKTKPPTHEEFAKLDYDTMVPLMKEAKNITEFQTKAFAGAAMKKFGKVVRDLARSMNESSLPGIAKDPVQSVIFVQRIINEEWPERSDD